MPYTKKPYTNNPNTVTFPTASKGAEKLAEVRWEPGTHDTLCGFPEGPRGNLGYYLYLVQKGELPPSSSSVPGIPDVFELRDEDERAWYRIIHLKRANNRIYVLHCFEKQSNQIEKRDVRTIQSRLSRLNQRLTEEKKNAKRETRKRTRNDGERTR